MVDAQGTANASNASEPFVAPFDSNNLCMSTLYVDPVKTMRHRVYLQGRNTGGVAELIWGYQHGWQRSLPLVFVGILAGGRLRQKLGGRNRPGRALSAHVRKLKSLSIAGVWVIFRDQPVIGSVPIGGFCGAR
jgi:hypothetical protein